MVSEVTDPAPMKNMGFRQIIGYLLQIENDIKYCNMETTAKIAHGYKSDSLNSYKQPTGEHEITLKITYIDKAQQEEFKEFMKTHTIQGVY